MEYQFTHTIHGVVAKCSMEHEAFALWLNSEINNHPNKLSTIFEQINHCRMISPNHYEWALEGREYSLFIDTDEVMVKANNLEITYNEDEMEEDFNFYDQESIAFCGLDDFEIFLKAYQSFLHTYH